MPQNQTRASAALRTDLLLVVFLIALDAVARILPHAPGFLPVAASALFAGRMLRIPGLALVVPVAAMTLSSPLLGAEDWRVLLVVYVAIAVPAVAGMWLRKHSGAALTVAAMVACSLIFFAASNFAVWAFSDMYAHTMSGLTQCYVAALPFLDKTVMGDLFWTAVLFGGAWLVQNAPSLARRAL
ncbi:MAG: DUF6580 family putative transport protein [Pseudolabrys sp.]